MVLHTQCMLVVNCASRTEASCDVQELKELIFTQRVPLCWHQSCQVRPACPAADLKEGPSWYLAQPDTHSASSVAKMLAAALGCAVK